MYALPLPSKCFIFLTTRRRSSVFGYSVAHHTSTDPEPITSSRISHLHDVMYYLICPNFQSRQLPSHQKKRVSQPRGLLGSRAPHMYHGVIFRGSRNFTFTTKHLTVGVWCCGRLSPLCALSCHHFLLNTAVSRRTDQRAQTTSQGQHQRQTRKCVN